MYWKTKHNRAVVSEQHCAAWVSGGLVDLLHHRSMVGECDA
jgi:hypothetical protein